MRRNAVTKVLVLSVLGMAGIPLFVTSTGIAGETAPSATKPALPADLFLKEEPANAKPVEEVKKTAKAGDRVIISGRVGGSKEPFVAKRAVLTLMGPGLPACGEGPAEDNCKTPWDYCCEPKEEILAHSATIQVVDQGGMPIKAELKDIEGIKELTKLVVVGDVVRAEGKTLVVNAKNIYVVKPAAKGK